MASTNKAGLTLSVKGARFDKTEDGRNSDVASLSTKEAAPPAAFKSPDAKKLDKFWKPSNAGEDIVVIHVCDENRQISKDFYCKRNLLVRHMKYFERFLAENENGYDDIDISVHCDVEIFEWLMTYVHEPDKPPILEKSIVVSILISSEFLQMDSLVDVCLDHIARSLNDIIKLPIDLSCISEKLVHKLASLTQPKVLAQTKDRKDKILNKLYKRRVELDFSRKSGVKGGLRTIASSLTCCRYCGMVFLENFVGQLTCRVAPPVIDFRGRLARKHIALQSWSLTAYLKALHAGGMSWDTIYWHVWASCQVLQAQDVLFSLLEVDRYSVQPDGVLVSTRVPVEGSIITSTLGTGTNSNSVVAFSLATEDYTICQSAQLKIFATRFEDPNLPHYITPTLNPLRSPEILSLDIFELLCSQMKFIANLQHKVLIDSTLRSMITSSLAAEGVAHDDFDGLWGEDAPRDQDGDDRPRGRSMSPFGQRSGKDMRKLAHSVGSKRTQVDDDAVERRSRSSSTGSRPLRASTLRDKDSSAVGSARVTDIESVTSDPESMAGEQSSSSSVLRNVPPDVMLQAAMCKGCFLGIRLAQHPLQTQPSAFMDARATIRDSGLSESRKFEWELDLIREYDEKKMDRYECYLMAARGAVADVQMLSNGNRYAHGRPAPPGRKKGAGDDGGYYKDRGRYPTKSC